MVNRRATNAHSYIDPKKLTKMASVNVANEDNVELVQQIERIQNHKNVQGLILVNAEGNPVRSNLDNSTSLQYTRHMEELKTITEHVVRDLDPRDELVVLRIRNKFNEIMVLPEQGCLVICIQARDDHLDEEAGF
ncbi:Dynein light chain roadblock-type [Fasciola gigantica]|uniref:Dynein light chain roadblock-type n=2 Tax=Fasciola TaxID=6191 RepID=A0A504YAQ2_FASGI|nr:Dynein light chain roadblock-type [Fasciola gigantica]